MAQLVEHILGKDEVPGPNPGSSSKIPNVKTFGIFHLWLAFMSPVIAEYSQKTFGCAAESRGTAALLFMKTLKTHPPLSGL